ncbi:MAG: large conductance mechanosensitive channel protein MscL [Corynebacteriales bacterium]|nr:large conductance mechanosensitive channel protein MscL [Mycobacteriales bacterium]
MIKGFREFITRGNVVDLAVGVVIGAAFNSLIGQFTKSFLEPLIRLATGGHTASGTFKVEDAVFDYGAFINAAITFFLTAAALYFLVVLPMNKLAERRGWNNKTEQKISQEVELLTEIRDALVRNNS